MYDSRSSHPRNRGSRWDRDRGYSNPFTATLPKRQEIDEQVLALIESTERARTINLDRLHGEALRMHEIWCDEREEADAHLTYQLYGGYEAIALWEWKLLTGQDSELGYADYVEEFEQQAADRDFEYDDDDYQPGDWRYEDHEVEPVGYSHDDCWMPLASIAQCREIFGGTDFTIRHTNVVRRRTA